jgi:hypothetical protein
MADVKQKIKIIFEKVVIWMRYRKNEGNDLAGCV